METAQSALDRVAELTIGRLQPNISLERTQDSAGSDARRSSRGMAERGRSARGFFALVECQGTQGECKEEYFNKLVGYMNLYKTESGKIDIQGLLIINYLRLMPPIQRPGMFEKHARGEEIRREAEKQGIGLLSAFELFKLVQAEKAKKITKKQTRDCLKRAGFILAEPWIQKCQKGSGS